MDKPKVILHQKARWLPADMDTPISLFKSLVGQGQGILLESAEVDGRWGRFSVLLTQFALEVSCQEGLLSLKINDERLKDLAVYQGQPFMDGLRNLMRAIQILPPEGFNDLSPITRALYGYFGFGLAALFNARLARSMPINEAECKLVLPSTTLVFDHLYNRLCQINLFEQVDLQRIGLSSDSEVSVDVEGITSKPDGEGYKGMVRSIKEMLVAGEAIQVVPSVRFSTTFFGDAFELYRRMRRFNASPYMFFMRFSDLTLFGSSPEVMVGATNGDLKLSPIAGTRRRGVDDREDEFLASELWHDPKERAEDPPLQDTLDAMI